MDAKDTAASLRFSTPDDGTLLVHLCGTWKMGREMPSADEVVSNAGIHAGTRLVRFDRSELDEWDSGLLTFLLDVQGRCASAGLEMDIRGLPAGAASLLRLASSARVEGAKAGRNAGTFSLSSIGGRFLGLAGDSPGCSGSSGRRR
jgi:phospholipid/cholesterol/gamma-HCH transport system permease protein